MELQSAIIRFLDDLQGHFNRKLTFSREVGLLLQQAASQNLDDVFRDAVFQAKFVTRTREVMNRIGREGEGFDKLSTEFQNSIEKSSALLKTIVKESPEEIKQYFVKDFFGLDQASFGNFLKLLEDLSWVKNFELDGQPLPLAGGSPKRSSQPSRDQDLRESSTLRSSEDIARIRNGAALSLVLIILLFLVDAPVTFLGWGLAIVVALLLVYIVLTSHRLVRKSDTSV